MRFINKLTRPSVRVIAIFIMILVFTISYRQVIFRHPSKGLSFCDLNEESKFIKTPYGGMIQKYNRTVPFKQYGDHLKYCTDDAILNDENCGSAIKFKGETVARSLHLIIMRLLHNIDIICKKHKIQYWLLAGTLLGAHRSQSIIPWDNDGDIGFFEEDFFRFIEIAKKELPNDIVYVVRDKDPLLKIYTDTPGGKVRDVNSCYGYCFREGCENQDGTQIDIFLFHKSEDFDETNIIYDNSGMYRYNVDDIFPTKNIAIEGIYLQSPKNIDVILTNDKNIGETFMIEPKLTCPKDGFLSIPWYSCEYIAELPKEQQTELIFSSITHTKLKQSFSKIS